NTQTGELDARTSSDIYLGSLTHDTPKSDHANIEVYKDTSTPVNVQLIIKNNTLYLDVSDKNIKSIVTLKDRPDITVHEGKEEDLTPLEEGTSFNYQSIIEETPYTKPKTPVNIKQVIYQTLAKLWQAGKGQKLLYIGFLVGAMVFAQAVSNIFNIITVEDSDFVEFPKQTIEVTGEFTYDDLTALENNNAISNVYYLATESVARLSTPPVYVGGYYQRTASIYSRTIPLTEIQSSDLSHGRMPTNNYEVVVDQAWVQDNIFNQDPYHALGFDEYDDLLRFTMPISTSSGEFLFEIVGISDTAAPVIYADETFGIMNELKDQVYPHSLLEDEINVVAGRDIQNENEILMPRMSSQDPDDFTPTNQTILGMNVTIVGLYEFIDDDRSNNHPIAPDALLREIIFNHTNGDNTERYVFANDVDEALNAINQDDMEGRYLYQELRDEFYTTQVRNAMPSLIFSGIVIVASAISFFFVIRSSMISRIYEIGVFRSLGTKKTHILKRFAIETAVLTTFSSFIGFSIMTYILYSAQQAIGDAFTIAHVSFLSVLTGIALLYAINILSGLLPVFILLRKTPAQINTQYDL
ncbi:MAG: ABC transporter permease, partial [Bacillota bacterium]